MTPVLQKVAAAQATLRAFDQKPLVWRVSDCAMMAVFHLGHFGHVVDTDRFGGYQTERGGLKALRKLGFDDLAAVLDSFGLERIAPAFAMASDIIGWALPDKPMMALTIALGNRRILGFHPELGVCCAQVAEFDRPGLVSTAWRVG